MSTDKTRCHTRIDSPSDLVFLEPEDPLVVNSTWKTGPRPFPHTTLTDAEWKAVGNEHFKAEEYFAAVVAYTSGLRQNPSFITLRLNRALSYLRLGNFAAALSESEEVLSTRDLEKDSKLKALYRAGQASYGQADYLGARGWYEKLLVEDPNHKDAEAGVERCGRRMKERKTGEYDMAALMKSSHTGFERHDIADYQGPIEVAPMEGRGGGRGVVATREIKMGELLVRFLSNAIEFTLIIRNRSFARHLSPHIEQTMGRRPPS
jgi:tetratricopeptide (TPR) repeat protein